MAMKPETAAQAGSEGTFLQAGRKCSMSSDDDKVLQPMSSHEAKTLGVHPPSTPEMPAPPRGHSEPNEHSAAECASNGSLGLQGICMPESLAAASTRFEEDTAIPHGLRMPTSLAMVGTKQDAAHRIHAVVD
eukprot:TRINITY_DN52426_c0_g1_i1.p3 TRINITY_DN52426_c0_g1~~TRINITY_DN52426_c0_g1_i1.p3  ORF type:complete len:132 (+),score=28.22 TRINITY_DN52426_c0_g1_i1:82-477(+)